MKRIVFIVLGCSVAAWAGIAFAIQTDKIMTIRSGTAVLSEVCFYNSSISDGGVGLTARAGGFAYDDKGNLGLKGSSESVLSVADERLVRAVMLNVLSAWRVQHGLDDGQ